MTVLPRQNRHCGNSSFIGLEEAAASICWYESELVPGLLQTDGYARAGTPVLPPSGKAALT
jgi:hypothetical protein